MSDEPDFQPFPNIGQPPKDRAEQPNQYGCTCPCYACRSDFCAMCEMGYP